MTKTRSPKPHRTTATELLSQSVNDNPTPEQQHELKMKELKERERELKNKERAFIAASRRSDRSLEKRIKSALQASEVHKEITGRYYKITEEIVAGDQMYEEEDDERMRVAHSRRFTIHSFNGQLGFQDHYQQVDEKFAQMYPTWPRPMACNPPVHFPQAHLAPQIDSSIIPYEFRAPSAHSQSQHRPYVHQGYTKFDMRHSYSGVRPAQFDLAQEHPAKYRRMSADDSSPIPASAAWASDPLFSERSSSRSSSVNSTVDLSPSTTPLTEPETPTTLKLSDSAQGQQLQGQTQQNSSALSSQVVPDKDYVLVVRQNSDSASYQSADAHLPMVQFDGTDFSFPGLDDMQDFSNTYPDSEPSDLFDYDKWDGVSTGENPQNSEQCPSIF